MKNNKLLLILSLVLLLSFGFVSALTPPTGGVSYWAFSNLTDQWDGNDAINSGATSENIYPSFNTSGNSSPDSLYFDGGDFAYIVDNASLRFSVGDSFSLTGWVRFDSVNDVDYLLTKRDSTNEGWYFRYSGTGGYIDWVAKTTNAQVPYVRTNWNPSVDTWYMITFVHDTVGNLSLWIDGVDIGVTSSSMSGTGDYFDNLGISTYFARKNDGTDRLEGYMDDWKIFNKSLSKDDIVRLYNFGDVSDVVPDNFSVSVVDFWSGSDVNNITVIVNGTTYINETGNSVTTTLLQNDSITYLVQVSGVNYFGKNYSNYNVSSDLIAELHQTEINFSVSEYITNATIVGGWCTVNTTSQLCSDSFNLSAGTYNVTFNKSSYLNKTVEFNVTALDNKTVNISGVYGSLVTFNLSDVVTSNLIGVTSYVSLESASTGSVVDFSAVNGSFMVPLARDNYSLIVWADGYSFSYDNITVDNISESFSYGLYSNNSVWVSAVDFDTDVDLVNFSVIVSNAVNIYSGNDSGSGLVMLDGLVGGFYTVSIIKDNYSISEYTLLMTGGSHQNIVAYLSSGASTTTFTLVDSISSKILEGVTGNMYKIVNSSYVLVSSQLSDITGRIQYSYASGVNYKFVMSVDGYEQRTFLLTPLSASYTVRLTPVTSAVPDLNVGDYVYEINNSGLFYNNLNNSFAVSISSGTGTIEYYNLTVTNFNGGVSSVDCANAYGCSSSFNFEIVNADFDDYVVVEYSIKESGVSEKYFKHVYVVQDVYDSYTLEGFKDVEDSEVDSLSKAFIVMIVCLVVVGFVSVGSLMVGVPPIVSSGIVLALLVEVFAYVDFIPSIAGHLVALGCLLIVIFGRGEL